MRKRFEVIVLCCLLLGYIAVGAWPVAAQEAEGLQYTVYLPLVIQQPTRPARLVAPADGAYRVQVQRGETQATWQWLFYCYDRDADGECDAPGGTIGELTASARSLDVRVPISAGERLELFLYADTYGSLVTPQPIFYAWDWQAREAAPAPLIVRGDSPRETQWDCDNDYDHRDLTLELSFVASVSREAAP